MYVADFLVLGLVFARFLRPSVRAQNQLRKALCNDYKTLSGAAYVEINGTNDARVLQKVVGDGLRLWLRSNGRALVRL